MNDAVQQANLVQRRVSVRMIESQWARTQTMSRVYAAAVDEVWDACTNPERISRWFLPVTGDLRLGGQYQLEGNAGGTIETCDPPHGFTATWEYGGDVSWIEVRLAPEPAGGTHFELEHIAHVTDERWAQFGPGATGVGWDLGLLSLDRHLESAGGEAPTDNEAWLASDEGREFMAQSSRRWCYASIAAGTNPAEAEAAAARTTAAYAGEPPT
jgi:uncharacterized protein YndB with AHSA1/START domain